MTNHYKGATSYYLEVQISTQTDEMIKYRVAYKNGATMFYSLQLLKFTSRKTKQRYFYAPPCIQRILVTNPLPKHCITHHFLQQFKTQKTNDANIAYMNEE